MLITCYALTNLGCEGELGADLIPYATFGRLRLADILPRDMEAEPRIDWEYMEDLWVGEGFGFTEFLRLDEDPEVVRSAAVDLSNGIRGWHTVRLVSGGNGS